MPSEARHPVRAVEVDERTMSWEAHPLGYRVYLFERRGGRYSTTETWDLDGGDVVDALAWAEEHATEPGTMYALALRQIDPLTSSLGLVWLTGSDVVHSDRLTEQEQRDLDVMRTRRSGRPDST